MSRPKAELDAPWKQILDVYFKDFIAYCWPDKYEKIDWEKGYTFLDKELSKIARRSATDNRVTDKLIKITLKTGQEAYIILHIEVQGSRDSTFEERMYTYRYRLWDAHRKPIASLAILIDSNRHWRPTTYRQELWGSFVEMGFPIIKIIDYKSKIDELEASTNRFATVILAQLAALEKQSAEAKLISQIKLVKWLYGRGWAKEDILRLLTFIEWVFVLPKDLELKYRQEIEKIEEELHVNYVTSFERMGIQKGESTILLELLECKFKTVPDAYRERVKQADPETLIKWSRQLLNSQALDEVFMA